MSLDMAKSIRYLIVAYTEHFATVFLRPIAYSENNLALIHMSEPTRQAEI